MTEEAIKEIIKKVTVKIEVSINGRIEKGTGVLIKQNDKYYVLTVYHCIYGKEEPYYDTQLSNVKLTFEKAIYNDTIVLININPYEKNLVLLEINNLNIDGIDYKCLDRVYDEKKYFLRGFPSGLNGKSHNFTATCNDSNIDTIGFSIDLNNLTDDTSGKDTVEEVSGLSGSGIFFSENNQLYLVGLVNEVGNRYGIFNRIDCVKLIDLHKSDLKLSKFYSIDDISKKLKDINKDISNEACKKFQQDNTELYSNLNRKHTTIFHKNEVFTKNFKSIQNYIEGKNSIKELKNLNSSFENYLLPFINETLKEIENFVTKYIDSKKEGRDNLIAIRDKTIKMIEGDLSLIKKDSYISNNLREYIVVGWLLNCDIDFILDEDS